MVFAVVVLLAAVVLALVLQFVIRPRLGRRGRMGVDALGGRAQELQFRDEVSHAAAQKVAPGFFQPGGPLLKGRAAKHLTMLSRTFIVRADPAVVDGVLRQTLADPDLRFAPTGQPVPGEVSGYEAQGMPFGPFPRLAVKPSIDVPGASEVGVTRLQWAMKFPQGAAVADKALDAVVAALAAQGMPSTVHVRSFVPGDQVRVDLGDRDGVWFADRLVADDAVVDLGK